MQERERLLEIEDLKVEYITDSGVVHAVNGVSFGLDHGEIIGIVGDRKSVV